jgi:threonine/homoserine/homoserine lactone efflux protein
VTDTLPLALGIAASPFPVVPALLLFTPRPRATSWSFLAGWFLGVGLVTAVAVLGADTVQALGSDDARWAAWARILLGVLLVGYGVKQWLGRREVAEPPSWMRSLGSATPASSFRLALLLSAANPKVLLLAIAGGVAIGTGTATGWGEAVAVLAFTAVASVSVALPVVSYAVGGERVLGPLGRAKDWLERNNAAVMSVVLVVLGLLVLQKGLTGL